MSSHPACAHPASAYKPPRARVRLAAALLALAIVGGPSATAQAANYRVRSITIGRATQYFRSDRTVDAPRIFTQGLSLWGYDLLGDKTGSLNMHVAIRYSTDFSLERPQRDNPYFADQWNELTLDLAYVDWQPFRALRLRFGRQWSLGALGARDFDGALVRFSPRVEADTTAHFEAYGGRDVQTAYGEFDAAQFDVQGIPPDDGVDDANFDTASLDGTHLLVGAAAGMAWGREASIDLSWRRRFSVGVDTPVDGDDTVVGSERVGAAAAASFHPRLVASAYGAYNAPLGAIDRAGADLSWRLPSARPAAQEGVVSAGVEHRVPWFDSSSIFNLFGARAYQGAFATYQRPVAALRTDFQVRGWGRVYHGDDHATAKGVGADDERAVGAAVQHLSRVHLWRVPVRWRSLVSYQTSLERGTDQFLADTKVRVPVFERELFVSGRGLFLAALSDHPRLVSDGYATTGVLGIDVPIATLGTLSAAVETTGGNIYPLNTSVYASFSLEHWP